MRTRTGLLSLAIIGALASVMAPTASAAQPDGQWKDPYIKAPRAIVAAAIDNCRYQISFERDEVDSRYLLSFKAEFKRSNGAVVIRDLAPATGGLAFPEPSITALSRYSLRNGYALAPFQVNVCAAQGSGESLIGFRLAANLDGPYTYRNSFRSKRIVPITTPGAVPTAPKITSSTLVPGTDKITLKWTPSTGGKSLSYRVLVNKPVYYGGDYEWLYYIDKIDFTGTEATVPLGTYKPELIRNITVLAFGGNGFASDTAAATEITAKQ